MNQVQTRAIYQHDYSGEGGEVEQLRFAEVAPPWRKMGEKEALHPVVPRTMSKRDAERGRNYLPTEFEASMVSCALMLRRPLLIEGQAGIGKSSLAYSVAWQLGLGDVLRWGVTTRSNLKDSLYRYDALARLHDITAAKELGSKEPIDFGSYLSLGPIGTALLPTNSEYYHPRVLLIDELDKGDADLPSDLLHVLEEGSFLVPEIARLPDHLKEKGVQVRTAYSTVDEKKEATIQTNGWVQCDDFPLIIMTSNGERDFPPAFKRRCLTMQVPWEMRTERLTDIVRCHFPQIEDESISKILNRFNVEQSRSGNQLAIDQLLNFVFWSNDAQNSNGAQDSSKVFDAVRDAILRSPADSGGR